MINGLLASDLQNCKLVFYHSLYGRHPSGCHLQVVETRVKCRTIEDDIIYARRCAHYLQHGSVGRDHLNRVGLILIITGEFYHRPFTERIRADVKHRSFIVVSKRFLHTKQERGPVNLFRGIDAVFSLHKGEGCILVGSVNLYLGAAEELIPWAGAGEIRIDRAGKKSKLPRITTSISG